jgi:hypothetical protein
MPDTDVAVIPSEARNPSSRLKGPSLRVREAGVGARLLAMGGRKKTLDGKTLYTGERTSEFLKDRLQLLELTEKRL